MGVWNDGGEVRAVCAVSDRVRPGVAWMPFGGFTDASGIRRSVNVLTPVEPTDWGGGSGLYDAFVEVRPRPQWHGVLTRRLSRRPLPRPAAAAASADR